VRKSDLPLEDVMDQKRFATLVYSIFDPFSILGKISHEKD
jgi:hypothetical protein